MTYDALNGPGFRYVISYKRRDLPDASEEQLAIREWRKNEIVIYDLEEFKPYEIYVQSVNDVGPFPGVVERRLAYTSEGSTLALFQFQTNDLPFQLCLYCIVSNKYHLVTFCVYCL